MVSSGQARLLPPPAMLQHLWMNSLALSPLPARERPLLALALPLALARWNPLPVPRCRLLLLALSPVRT